MNILDFKKIVESGNESFDAPIVLDSGVYDGHGAVLTARGGVVVANSKTYLKNITVEGNITVESGASDVAIQNCTLKAQGTAILSYADNVVIRGNVIEDADVAVRIAGGCNCLVAQIETDGDIRVESVNNCSVVLNTAKNISAISSCNVYVVDNIATTINVSDINHLICDGNKYVNLMADGNDNFNGNDVTDVNARLEVGANEELLPHTDRDLFVGMKRRDFVCDVMLDEPLGINEYVRYYAERDDVVIVPPGAYSAKTCINLKPEHSNTTIYAYGVYEEYSDYGRLLIVDGADDVNIYGLQMGYTIQSSGQVYILEKLGDRRAKVVTAAGYINDFGKSDLSMFSGGFMDVYPAGEMFNRGNDFYEAIEHNDDGTMTLTFKFQHVYDSTNAGDICTCRIKSKEKVNNTSVTIKSSAKNLIMRDCVIYGYSAGLAVVSEDGRSENLWLDRVHNTVHTGYIISKETYDWYRTLEEKYGVCLEVYVDEKGRYRGSQPRVGSCDATHIFGIKQGICCRSCLFENMTDDGNNQRGNSARMSDLIDNGDGTTTIVYKSNLNQWYYNNWKIKCGHVCLPFKKGDIVYAYGPDGQTVCETDVISNTEPLEDIQFTLTYNDEERECIAHRYAIKVRTEDVNFEAVRNVDLSDNRYERYQKVIVDNMSRNSANFTFDNVLIRNTRSRAMLVKARGANIVNCTFRNIACAGIMMTIEPEWGESSVARDEVVSKCLFDHMGYHNNEYFDNIDLAPIVIKNFSTILSENTIQGKNITIEGCKFTNIPHHHTIIVHSAQNVKIINNTFDSMIGETTDNVGRVADIDMAVNVEISGNKYLSPYIDSPVKAIKAKNNKNVFGTDISDENGNSLIPDNIPEEQ
jgi:hypothetical protein